MYGFIEVTRKDDGKRILLNVSAIDGVFPEAKGSFVAARGTVALFSKLVSGYYIEETYWEVKELIKKSQTVTIDDIESLEE